MSDLIKTKQELLKLIKEAEAVFSGTERSLLDITDYVAEYLAANGAIVANEETVKQYGAKVADDLYKSGFRSVVLCRECEHLGFKDFDGVCRGGPMCGIVNPWDYCSHGVKKEKGAGHEQRKAARGNCTDPRE